MMSLELEPTVGHDPELNGTPVSSLGPRVRAGIAGLGGREEVACLGGRAGLRGRYNQVKKALQGLWIFLHVGLAPKLCCVSVKTPPSGQPV